MVDPGPEPSIVIEGLRVEARLSTHGARVRHRALGPKGEPLVVDLVPVAELGEAEREGIVRLSAELRAATAADDTIARVLRVGDARGAGGQSLIYLARADVAGPTLEQHLASRREAGAPRRSLQEAITLLQPIAQAVDRLHAREQAHLLLSPSSIVLAGESRRLVDHGIAALLALAGAPPERAIAHCAPEQVDPALGAPSAFCDVFSLALLFMEVVLDASVFSSIAASDYYARLVDRGARPTFREHGLGVSPSVERALTRALAVDPRSRWPRAGAFWEALAEAVRVSPGVHAIAAPPRPRSVAPPAAPSPRRAIHRGRESQVLAAAVAVGITVFGIETFWRARLRGHDAPAITVATGSAAPSASVSAAPSVLAVAPSPAPSPSAEQPPPLAMVPVAVGNARFLVDRTEVTVADYRACIDAGKCTTTRETGYGFDEGDPLRKFFVCNLHVEGRAHHPINCVSWKQATTYCVYAGKRLPREREWELAAHGGTKSRFPWGRDTPTCTRAVFARYGKEQWGCKDEPVGTADVDAHPDGASPCGALDLAGNLWEWTAEVDGNLAALRGGGWDSSESNLTTTSRIEQAIFNGDVNVGFRCVKDP